MSVTKLKPARSPRVMDEWAEQNASACKETARISQDVIQKSKKLVEQSREIKARMEGILLKKSTKSKAS